MKEAAHRSGRRKNEDQDTRNNKDGTAHRGNQTTQVVDVASPLRLTKDPLRLDIGPFLGLLANKTVSPVLGLIPGRVGMGGAVLSMDANGETLKNIFGPQSVEYVCPFGGYGCTEGVSKTVARNPDMKMAR